jgi:hypothetical protein
MSHALAGAIMELNLTNAGIELFEESQEDFAMRWIVRSFDKG